MTAMQRSAALFVLLALTACASGPGWRWRRWGRRDQSARDASQRAQDTLDALDRGRQAVARGQSSGDTPDQRVRGNDGAWQ